MRLFVFFENFLICKKKIFYEISIATKIAYSFNQDMSLVIA